MLRLREPAHTTLKYSHEGRVGERKRWREGWKKEGRELAGSGGRDFAQVPFYEFAHFYHENQFLINCFSFFPTSCYFWSSFPRVSDQSLFYLDSAPCPHAAVPAARDYPISKLSASHYLDEELASKSGLV